MVIYKNYQFKVAAFVLGHLDLLQPAPRSVALFGSWVRGEAHSESDIDLLCIGDQIPSKPFERTRWVYPLLQAWRKVSHEITGGHYSLSPLLLSETGWIDSTGLLLSLADESWILMDDGFLSSSLTEARRWIREGLWSKKLLTDKGWLWTQR